MSIPLTLDGKDFEALIIDACEKLPGVSIARYGTRSVKIKDEALTKLAGRPVFTTLEVPSLPDFDIAIAPLGQQRVIEAKVNSQASFGMNPSFIKVSQVEHMLARAAVGVPCWLLIHWCERKSASGMTRDGAGTVALPVGDQFHPRWRNYVNAQKVAKKLKADAQKQPAITRAEAYAQGRRIGWIIPERCRNAVPDLAPLLGVRREAPPQGQLF